VYAARQGLHPAARHSAGLPITTVNIAKLGISVYRVNERGLDRSSALLRRTSPAPSRSPNRGRCAQWLTATTASACWRGTMEVRNVPEPAGDTAFPIRETVKDWKPGAYFVVMWNAAQPPARDEDDDEAPTGATTGMWVSIPTSRSRASLAATV
jgi:uncharacterized protein YfaS (alpha-2-macroglobulin family)